jgi:mRNA-degrading endonuclease RelE of RelBE toxin-antitoxin system
MSYTLLLTPTAQRDLRKLETITQRRIVRRLEELAGNPRMPDALKLQGEDLYRARVATFASYMPWTT